MSACKFPKMNSLTSCEIQTLEIQIELMQTQYGGQQKPKSTVQFINSRYVIEASLNHILTNGWNFVGSGQAKRP